MRWLPHLIDGLHAGARCLLLLQLIPLVLLLGAREEWPTTYRNRAKLP